MPQSQTRFDFDLDGIGHVLADRSLKVPKYQRSYAWGERQVRDLFNDLERAIGADEEEYFLGTIVLAAPDGDDEEVPEVVDGQQRLATTTILLAAIRDYFDAQGEVAQADGLHQPLLVLRDRRTQDINPKLTLNDSDNDFFLKRVLDRDPRIRAATKPTRDSHARIARAAELAAAHVETLAKTQKDPMSLLLDRVEYIERNAKIMLVVVPSLADAFIIFETLNDRGLDLAISDLLKNYLFRSAGRRVAEIQQRWVSMYDLFVSADNEENVVDYIRQLWSSKHGLTRTKELYERIKDSIKGPQSAINFGNDLERGARYYQAIVNTNHPLWAKYGTGAQKHMATLNDLGITRIRPLILAVFERFTETEARKALKMMVSWAVRFMIVGGLGTGALEEHYSARAKEISSQEIKNASELRAAMEKIVPSDARFKDSFSTATVSKSSLARYYLRVLERAAMGEEEPELLPNENEEEINLEHVLPEEPANKWPNLDAEIYEVYHHRLGNLALMKQQANRDIGNEAPTHKQAVLATSRLRLTREIAEMIGKAKSWGPEQIEERQKRMAELAIRAWSLRFDK